MPTFYVRLNPGVRRSPNAYGSFRFDSFPVGQQLTAVEAGYMAGELICDITIQRPPADEFLESGALSTITWNVGENGFFTHSLAATEKWNPDGVADVYGEKLMLGRRYFDEPATEAPPEYFIVQYEAEEYMGSIHDTNTHIPGRDKFALYCNYSEYYTPFPSHNELWFSGMGRTAGVTAVKVWLPPAEDPEESTEKFYALVPFHGSAAGEPYVHITAEQAEAIKLESSLLIDVTGFGAYTAPDENEDSFRNMLGPLLPGPGNTFTGSTAIRTPYWEEVRIEGGGSSETLPMGLIEYEATRMFPLNVNESRVLSTEKEGGFIWLRFRESVEDGPLGLKSFSLYAAPPGVPGGGGEDEVTGATVVITYY